MRPGENVVIDLGELGFRVLHGELLISSGLP